LCTRTAPLTLRLTQIGTRNLSQNGAEWRIPNGLTMFFSLFLMIGILFAPESPRWLFGEGRHEEAERSLARIRGVKVEDNDYTVRQTYEEMKAAVDHESRMDKFRWIDCFKPHNKMLYRTILLAVLQAGQQLTGAVSRLSVRISGHSVLGGINLGPPFVHPLFR
jgi:SP family sugar:H+ symporter-like MFS transporter